jgi:fatty-acid desaturase
MESKELFKPKPNDFSPEEVKNSNRIQKSATPKYTLDWYIKWIASALLLVGMSMRGIAELIVFDLSISAIGVTLWLWVSILWKDRALIVVNSVGLLLLIRNLIGVLYV